MIEYVVMDYDGEPVSIEEGEILLWEPETGEHWNSSTCQFEADEEEEEYDDYDDYEKYKEDRFRESLRYYYWDKL